MKYKIFCGCAILAFALTSTPAHAQTKNSWTFTCPPAVQEQIITSNAPGNITSGVSLGECSVAGDINSSAGKTLALATYGEVSGNQFKVWGVIAELLADGDEVRYMYITTGTLVNGLQKTAQMTYQIAGANGKEAGITGTGVCAILYNPGGGSNASCTGQYTIP